MAILCAWVDKEEQKRDVGKGFLMDSAQRGESWEGVVSQYVQSCLFSHQPLPIRRARVAVEMSWQAYAVGQFVRPITALSPTAMRGRAPRCLFEKWLLPSPAFTHFSPWTMFDACSAVRAWEQRWKGDLTILFIRTFLID